MNNTIQKKIINLLFFLYMLFIIIFVISKFDFFTGFNFDIKHMKENRAAGFWNINIIPFKTILTYMEDYFNGYKPLNIVISNLLGNIIVFIPMGFFIVKIFNLKFYQCIFSCIIIITFFETVQFITMIGFFDVDDIILNTIGCIMGYISYKILRKLINHM